MNHRVLSVVLVTSSLLAIPVTVMAQQPGTQSQNAAAAAMQAQLRMQQQQAQQLNSQQGGGQVHVPLVSAAQAIQAGLAQPAQPPFPPLNEQLQKFVDDVLLVWEQRTAAIDRYQCSFKRWDFDTSVHPTQHASEASGNLRYMKPDKGLYDVHEVLHFDPDNGKYEKNERLPFGEYWICDGQFVMMLNRNEKKAHKFQIPPDMQGEGIQESPLPFVFCIKASAMKERYWIQPLAYSKQDTIVLEVYPKQPRDAANYSRVQVFLDKADVLPKALVVFLPTYDGKNQAREVYEFTNREANFQFLDRLKESLFRQEFIPKELPKDWEIVFEPYNNPQDAVTAGQGSPDPILNRAATPPASLIPRR
ncbi:MAG: TIGR03009 domain-containing protein [Planctomycetales bacterium]|nr:TIGR03009 domain-containing protein [Planctomycetales bacterium]